MLKHLLVGAVLTSSVALAGNGHPAGSAGSPTLPPAGRAMMPGPASSSTADDRIDAMRAAQLLRDFESAAARRDRREMARVDARLQGFVDQELAEARRELATSQRGRPGRGNGRNKSLDARRDVHQLEALQRQFAGLFGRVDRQAVSQKRTLYQQARTLARVELSENGLRRG
jgi:hypothetical protein